MKNNKTEAFVLQKFGATGKAFQLQAIELNDPIDHEVLIEVESFGLNYADIMAKNGLYRECPPLPTVVGYEVVGTVVKIGTHVDSSILNKKVVAFTQFGGYSKMVKTFDYAIQEIGKLDNHTALSLCTQGVTAYYMTHVATQIRKDELVLIHAAAGGVGNILIQIAKDKGATVIAKIGNDKKIDFVKTLGADFIVNYNKVDYKEAILKAFPNRKIDVIFNPVGGTTLKKDMSLLAVDGRLLFFGGSELSGRKFGFLSQIKFISEMGIMLPIALMMQSKSILGVNMYKIALEKPQIISECLKNIIQLYQQNKVNPILGKTYKSSNFEEAINYLESGKSVGKIKVDW